MAPTVGGFISGGSSVSLSAIPVGSWMLALVVDGSSAPAGWRQLGASGELTLLGRVRVSGDATLAPSGASSIGLTWGAGSGTVETWRCGTWGLVAASDISGVTGTSLLVAAAGVFSGSGAYPAPWTAVGSGASQSWASRTPSGTSASVTPSGSTIVVIIEVTAPPLVPAAMDARLPTVASAITGGPVNPAVLARPLPGALRGALPGASRTPAALAAVLSGPPGLAVEGRFVESSRLPLIQASMPGTSRNAATMAVSLPRPTAALEGAFRVRGSLACVLPQPLRGAVAGAARNPGVLAPRLPLLAAVLGSVASTLQPGRVRRDLWRVELLDDQDRTRRILDGVTGGSLEWSIFSSVSGSGQIGLDGDQSIDWLRDRIRITHVDGERVTPLGVWLISMPGRTVANGLVRLDVKLSDKTELLNAPVGAWVTFPAGTVVTDAVARIISARGESSVAITPSSEQLGTALSWRPEDTWLKVVNELLGAINYSSIWADMLGRLVVGPYVPLEQRPTVATYGPEASDLDMLPSWSDEADIFGLPTGVRIYVEGSDEVVGFVGSADLPDSSPLSAAALRRDRLHVESGEATTQAVADAIAARRLDDRLQVTRRVSVGHPMDAVQLRDVVLHRPLGLRAVVVQRKISLSVGAVVEDTIRHIYTGGELPWT